MRFISFRNIQLRQKLISIFILFIVSPITISGLFFYQSSEDYVSERTNKETTQMLTLLKQNVDQLLRGYEAQLLSLYDNETMIQELRSSKGGQGSEDSINRYLRDFLRGKDDFVSIYLFSHLRDNVYFADFKGPDLFMEQYRNHPEWEQALKASRGHAIWLNTYMQPPNQYSSENTYYFMIGMQVKNIVDLLQTLGSVIINVKVEALGRIMNQAQVSPNGFVLIADEHGDVIWHRNPDAFNVNVDNQLFFQDILQSRNHETRKLNGKSYRITYVQSDYNHWYYIAFVPMTDLSSETQNLKNFMTVALIGSGIVFSILALLTTLYVTKPLKRMVIAMKRIDKDSFQTEFQPASTDEIGILQTAFNSMRQRISDLIEEVRRVTAKEKEAELKALQAQINPHFMYNSLDTINWMAIEKKETEISSMITALSDILRYAIKPGAQLVTIKEELEWAKNYAFVQKNRFEDRFDIDFEIDDQALTYKIPRLLLQPYIENSILHGMEDIESGGMIRIEVKLERELNRIVFRIEDNGTGMSEERMLMIQDRRHEGIGLYNLDERLKLEYGSAYGVSLQSVPGAGTTVTIYVPCIREGS